MNKKKPKEKKSDKVDLLSVGSALKTTKEVHKTTSGTKAVCLGINEDADRKEFAFAFPNGRLFIVDASMVEEFFDFSTMWHIPELSNYKFKDEETFKEEFKQKLFNSAWK